MDSDQYNLSNLRDIFIPEAPSFWPPAPGVWIASGIVVVLLIFAGWRFHAARKRNAYRKAGLKFLQSAKTSHDVAVVVKRVALAVFPRERVASLYGNDWVDFLCESCPGHQFSAMRSSDASSEASEELVELARLWIRRHRVPVSRPVAT